MYFRNVGNIRNICNLKSITDIELIQLIYMVNIVSIIHRREYCSVSSDDIGVDLLVFDA